MEIGLTKEQYLLFIKDAMRLNIVLGGGCNNNCTFCFLKSKLGRPSYINYISIEDLRSCIDFIEIVLTQNNDKTINFGDGSLLLSCEPFKHPQYLELLREVNILLPGIKKKSATVGKGINPDWYDELKKSNINYHVSVITFDEDKRREIIKSKDDYSGMMNFLKECKEIITKISLIHTGDLDVLKRDIETLHSIDDHYKNIPIRFGLPDYSKFHPEDARILFNKAHSTWHEANKIICSLHPACIPAIRSLSDFPLGVSRVLEEERNKFDNRMTAIINQIKSMDISLKDVGFLFPESSYEYSAKYDVNRIFVKNNSNGGSYVISYFVAKDDVYKAIENLNFKLYVISKNVFDDFGRDIAGNKITDYKLNLLLG